MANINRDDAPQSNKSFQFSIWKRLGPFIKPYRWLLLLIIVTNIIISIVDVLLPLFQRYAVDNFIEQKSLQGFQTFIVGYLAVIVLQVLSFVFYTLSAMKMEMRMGRDLKRACFVHLQTLSFSYYNVTPVGYILARVMSDTNKIASITAWDLIDILWALTYVVCAFISMAMLDLRLALMVMVIVPVIAVLTAYFQKKILFWNRKVRAINSRITGAFNEGIMGAKTSKTLVIEDKNTHEFAGITEEMRSASVRAAGLNAVYIPLVMLASSAATAIVLVREWPGSGPCGSRPCARWPNLAADSASPPAETCSSGCAPARSAPPCSRDPRPSATGSRPCAISSRSCPPCSEIRLASTAIVPFRRLRYA